MRAPHVRRVLFGVVLGLLLGPAVQAQEPAKPVGTASGMKLPGIVKAMLHVSMPCPNCDAVQTWVGRKPTPLPSPLPAKASSSAAGAKQGDQVRPSPAAEPGPLDELTWAQVKLLLPVGLRGK